MMKGRGDDRRLLERGIKLNVMALVNNEALDVKDWPMSSTLRTMV
jgi:hypothetical protein